MSELKGKIMDSSSSVNNKHNQNSTWSILIQWTQGYDGQAKL